MGQVIDLMRFDVSCLPGHGDPWGIRFGALRRTDLGYKSLLAGLQHLRIVFDEI